jgi:hypothetical protein
MTKSPGESGLGALPLRYGGRPVGLDSRRA